ncbi:tryptophan 2,3-dioxygenase [Kitasatospora sp. NPDC056327]|uniref:tryptophan 2,3-dioxygenase n=1 Tax=Kitasatospora sp. NPDC056327 TaxID=3345785 RepID=UPI0035DEBFE3
MSDTPFVQFEGVSPYEDYVHADVLGSLQQPLTDAPDEMGFLITTQVMELWFTLTVHEWRAAAECFSKDDAERALDALERSIRAHRALNDSWHPIAALTPGRFNSFRAAFGRASGSQSATYRHMEFLLGDKSREVTDCYRNHPAAHEALTEALGRPSLYDEVLRFLRRQGLPVPRAVCERDVTEPYRADPGVEEVWRRLYAGPPHDPLLALAERLTDLAELVQRWRTDHVVVVRRAMGGKTGSAGSSGVAWLEDRAARPVFPELWTARGLV